MTSNIEQHITDLTKERDTLSESNIELFQQYENMKAILKSNDKRIRNLNEQIAQFKALISK